MTDKRIKGLLLLMNVVDVYQMFCKLHNWLVNISILILSKPHIIYGIYTMHCNLNTSTADAAAASEPGTSENQRKCFGNTTWVIDHLSAPTVSLWNGPKIFAWNKWGSLSRPASPRPKVYCRRCRLHLAPFPSSPASNCSDAPLCLCSISVVRRRSSSIQIH